MKTLDLCSVETVEQEKSSYIGKKEIIDDLTGFICV